MGFATADAIGHFHGVTEKFAHTRTFIQMEMEFYVDNAYRSLKFLEHWTEFIASGSDALGANKLRMVITLGCSILTPIRV